MNLILENLNEFKLSVFSCVRRLREQRFGMVQTPVNDFFNSRINIDLFMNILVF
jgi:hypothetical protein